MAANRLLKVLIVISLGQLNPLLQPNILNGGFTMAQGVDTDICSETTGSESLPPLVPANLHVSMASATNGELGQVTIMSNVNTNRSSVTYSPSPAEEFKAIFDAITNQILIIDNKADQFDVENCQVQNATQVSFTSLMAKVNVLGSAVIIPTANFFNTTGLKVNYDGYEFLNKMNTVRYRTCHNSSSIGMTLEVTWWISQDNNTFVQMKTRYGKTQQGSIVETYYYPSPFRSMSDKQDATKHQFMAPKGVYCKGLIAVKQAPSTYSRFSLSADRYIYQPNLPAQGPDTFRESYDQSVNLTMMEGEGGTTSALNKTKFGSGRLARIDDFTRGISYVKNLRYQNCTYERIPTGEWDSNPDPNGPTLKAPDDFYFPSLAELQYKGSGVYRSVDVDVYVGYKDKFLDTGDGKKYPLTLEYYLDIEVNYEGEGIPIYKSVPLAVYTASTLKFNALVEAFDFNIGVPRSYDHDISDCFLALQKLHFELMLPFNNLDPNYIRYLYDYRSEFTYSLVRSLSRALNISPLRIIQPVVSVFADPLFMLVEITVADRAFVPGYTPPMPENELSQVTSTLADMIARGSLIVQVIEEDMVFDVPVGNFTVLQARGLPPTVRYKGIQTGSVIGLSIGTLVIGVIMGFGILFAISWFRERNMSA